MGSVHGRPIYENVSVFRSTLLGMNRIKFALPKDYEEGKFIKFLGTVPWTFDDSLLSTITCVVTPTSV